MFVVLSLLASSVCLGGHKTRKHNSQTRKHNHKTRKANQKTRNCKTENQKTRNLGNQKTRKPESGENRKQKVSFRMKPENQKVSESFPQPENRSLSL
jgi:hypothetical protein